MSEIVTKVHPADNVLVALKDLSNGEHVQYNGEDYTIIGRVPAKHKFVTHDIQPNGELIMYGVLVGKAQTFIPRGSAITTSNVKHAAKSFRVSERKIGWLKPDVAAFEKRTFMGYHRGDGKVGTANYWLVIPMVFCENRNLEVLQEALVNELGYGRNQTKKAEVSKLIDYYRNGKNVDEILNADVSVKVEEAKKQRLFKNVDGIKFLTHDGGCGGTRQDARALCGLLAGYIIHPNVAGATVLSLGCQNAQVDILKEEINRRDP
ncbi:MAG TPA: UxaA family hydrolase, partial [Chitinophagaceae bacterium]|nr:UxaA family hydrolase [Chitinophagaceae bacterium]